MNYRLALASLCMAAALISTATAQQKPRKLAPGVLTTIRPAPLTEETFAGPLPIVELASESNLEWTPNFAAKTDTLLEKSKIAILRRPVWNLEFSFKPLRMVRVDVPQPTGVMKNKLVWYLVYRIRYLGEDLTPTAQEDTFGNETFPSTTPGLTSGIFFLPKMTLESKEFGKRYLDRVIPAALEPIAARERIGKPLFNSITISSVALRPSTAEEDNSVWGVATWEDVDPRIDFFSVYIKGLTNAYRFVDPPGVYKVGDPAGKGRQFSHKHLQLNFWRPGDTVQEHEREIRYGVPIESDPADQAKILKVYGLKERLDHLWIYR